ncbi:MAG: flavin reductase [Muribaculaceae bacterium]
MDITVLFKLTYGLYVVGCLDGDRPVGCTINTCFQVTSENPILAISLNKNNYTLDAIKRNKRFSLSIIAEESDTSVIGQFGFCSSRTVDKYADYGYDVVEGAPLVKGTFAGRLILDALTFVDNETHVVVMARLVDTVKGEGTPMTYDYYHRVVKGKAPKNAPTFVAERDEVKEEPKAAKRRYRCNMCGYVAEFDGEMPADYHCPLCRVDSSMFTAL